MSTGNPYLSCIYLSGPKLTELIFCHVSGGKSQCLSQFKFQVPICLPRALCIYFKSKFITFALNLERDPFRHKYSEVEAQFFGKI